MCGIYGFQVRRGLKLAPYESSILAVTLASEMESRGRDSWGGIIFPKYGAENKEASVLKGVGEVTSKGTELLRGAAEAETVLGHTRFATMGRVCAENSHPFHMGDVMGVHNGVIYNHEELNKKHNRTFAVDSQHVFAHIDEGKDLAELEGYGTFFFTRKSEDWQNIYFAHTTTGALTVARLFRDKNAKANDPNFFCTVWASESYAIRKAAKLLGVEFHVVTTTAQKLYLIRDGDVFNTKETFNITGTRDVTTRSYQRDWSNDRIKGSGYNPTPPKYHGDGEDGTIDLTGSNNTITGYKETRKERKARRKRELSLRDSLDWKIQTADPVGTNIRGISSIPKAYYKTKETDEQVSAHPLCPHCQCELKTHKWGLCRRSMFPVCKARAIEPCRFFGFKICRDCGCYLAETIHQEAASEVPGVIWCNGCNNYCATEADLAQEESLEEPTPKERPVIIVPEKADIEIVPQHSMELSVRSDQGILDRVLGGLMVDIGQLKIC